MASMITTSLAIVSTNNVLTGQNGYYNPSVIYGTGSDFEIMGTTGNSAKVYSIITNKTNSSTCMRVYAEEYDFLLGDYSESDSQSGVKGKNYSVTVSIDRHIANRYYYIHEGTQYGTSNWNYANTYTLADQFKYQVFQS